MLSSAPWYLASRVTTEDRGFASPCWIWGGTQSGRPGHLYGHVRYGTRSQCAHRVFYELANGPIPPGLHLDHLCRQTLCVNPEHLEAVTPAENVRRGRGAKLSLEIAGEICAARDQHMRDNPLTLEGKPRKQPAPGFSRELAQRYGVTVVAINCVLRGRTWRPTSREEPNDRHADAAA